MNLNVEDFLTDYIKVIKRYIIESFVISFIHGSRPDILKWTDSFFKLNKFKDPNIVVCAILCMLYWH